MNEQTFTYQGTLFIVHKQTWEKSDRVRQAYVCDLCKKQRDDRDRKLTIEADGLDGTQLVLTICTQCCDSAYATHPSKEGRSGAAILDAVIVGLESQRS